MGPTIPNLFKHRDYCGDIANHIEVLSVTLMDDSEVEQALEEADTVSEGHIEAGGMTVLTPKKEVPVVYYSVMMTWKHEDHGSAVYEYVIGLPYRLGVDENGTVVLSDAGVAQRVIRILATLMVDSGYVHHSHA